MQVPPSATSASRLPRSPRLAAPLGPAVAGVTWLAISIFLGWVVFGTPLLSILVSLGMPATGVATVGSTLLVGAAWAVALTAPAGMAILGMTRLASALGHARGTHRSTPPVSRRASQLPAGCVVIPRIRLPDGSRIPDVVVGPHGVAFFETLPPPAATRRSGDRWEVRFSDRRWRPIENPLQRAARDGDRLRRFLEAAQDRDFVVRVQAAVIADRTDVQRSDGCAVVRLEDVPAWIAALPAQRALTPERVAHVHEILAALS